MGRGQQALDPLKAALQAKGHRIRFAGNGTEYDAAVCLALMQATVMIVTQRIHHTYDGAGALVLLHVMMVIVMILTMMMMMMVMWWW